MNNCTVCDGCFGNENPNKIICDGICRQSFHAECANFSKNALLCYREMPNLQWFCDGCIIQTRSSNVSSPLFNKFNSTVVIPTSSPSYVQRSFPAASCKRKRIPSAKLIKSSALLVTKYPKVNRDIKKANDLSSPPSMQLTNHSVTSPCANGLKPPTTSVINQSDGVEHKPKHENADFRESLTVPSTSEISSATSSSFAKVLSTSSIVEHASDKTESSSIQSQRDSIQSQSIASPVETHKVAYLSNLHPSVTEKEIIDYLLMKKVITSAEDVSCKKLVSPHVNMDSLSFVSFKVAVNSELFHTIVDDKLWPDNVIAREFVKR